MCFGAHIFLSGCIGFEDQIEFESVGINDGEEVRKIPKYLASIKNARGIHQCGAVAISPHFLLTAAHCPVTDQIRIRGVNRAVLAELDHPDFDPEDPAVVRRNYDLRVIRLTDDYEMVDFIALGAAPAKNSLVRLAGFGKPNVDGIAGRFRVGVAPVSSRRIQHFTTTGAGSHANVCQGDSGGPATKRDAVSGGYSLVGIISQSSVDCVSQSWMTRIDGVNGKWISKTMRQLNAIATIHATR